MLLYVNALYCRLARDLEDAGAETYSHLKGVPKVSVYDFLKVYLGILTGNPSLAVKILNP